MNDLAPLGKRIPRAALNFGVARRAQNLLQLRLRHIALLEGHVMSQNATTTKSRGALTSGVTSSSSWPQKRARFAALRSP